MIKNVLVLIFFVILSTLLSNCASEGAPPGGPKDEIGPSILSTIPTNGELLVARKSIIQFEFTEPVNYKTVENSLTIFPALENKPTIKINRNKVKIIPKEKLKENTTYIFSFGRKVEDYQKNKTDGEVKIAFSTGDQMDKSLISGKLFDFKEEKKTAYILFYSHEEKDLDSLIFYDPDYYTSVDKNGNFQASNISKGRYSVLAYLGSFKNAPRFSESDFTAVGFEDFVELESGNDTLRNINLRLHQYPLYDFTYQKSFEEEGELRLMFSHPIDYDKSDIEFNIEGKVLTKNWWFDPDNPLNLNLSLNLDSAEYLMNVKGLIDIYGREMEAATDTILWMNPEIIDTLGAGVKFVVSGTKDVTLDEIIKLQFTEPVESIDNLKERINFIDKDSNDVDFSVEQIDITSYLIKPTSNLKYIIEYKLSALVDSIFDLFGNECKDSVISSSFTTIDEDLYGSISGSVDTQLDLNKIIIGCKSVAKQESIQYIQPEKNGVFKIGNLIPGEYEISIFYDENENGDYDWGSLIPNRSSEKYKDFPKAVSVRSRWETERVDLKF